MRRSGLLRTNSAPLGAGRVWSPHSSSFRAEGVARPLGCVVFDDAARQLVLAAEVKLADAETALQRARAAQAEAQRLREAKLKDENAVARLAGWLAKLVPGRGWTGGRIRQGIENISTSYDRLDELETTLARGRVDSAESKVEQIKRELERSVGVRDGLGMQEICDRFRDSVQRGLP